MIRMQLNVGVRFSDQQRSLYATLSADSGVKAIVEMLDARLSSSTFLGGQKGPSAVDFAVAGALYDLFSLGFPASVVSEVYGSSLPGAVAVSRWFVTVTSLPAFEAAGLPATGGRVRVGGQIDYRASPLRVAAMADASIEKNSGHKKAESQRDKERAVAEDPAAPAPAPAAPAVAAVTATASQPESNKTFPSLPTDEKIAIAEKKLASLDIAFRTVRHAAANNMEELFAALAAETTGTRCKNLFIKAKKAKDENDSRMWLVVAAADTNTNLTALATKLGYGKIVLRFAEAEDLLENLGAVQGHVSPLALLHDQALKVNVAIDAKITKAESGPLFFHPLTNEASTAIAPADLLKYVAETGHKATIVEF